MIQRIIIFSTHRIAPTNLLPSHATSTLITHTSQYILLPHTAIFLEQLDPTAAKPQSLKHCKVAPDAAPIPRKLEFSQNINY
jgi:hypothetical protein